MAVHHGGEIGSAAQKLVSKKTRKSTKAKASKAMNEHKIKYHKEK